MPYFAAVFSILFAGQALPPSVDLGESCKLAISQLLLRSSDSFHIESVRSNSSTISFRSTVDGEEREIDCEANENRLIWRTAGERPGRWRNQPRDEKITVRNSGFVDVTQGFGALERRSSDLEISPFATTYLVKMLMSGKADEVLALRVVDTIVKSLDTIGGNKNNAFDCTLSTKGMIDAGAINLETLKMDLEECVPGASGAIAIGAGLDQLQFLQAASTGRLEARQSLFQLSEVYEIWTRGARPNVYSDFTQYRDEVGL